MMESDCSLADTGGEGRAGRLEKRMGEFASLRKRLCGRSSRRSSSARSSSQVMRMPERLARLDQFVDKSLRAKDCSLSGVGHAGILDVISRHRPTPTVWKDRLNNNVFETAIFHVAAPL